MTKTKKIENMHFFEQFSIFVGFEPIITVLIFREEEDLLISIPEYSGWLSPGSSAQYRLVLAPISADNMNMLLSFPAALVINSGNKSEYYGLVSFIFVFFNIDWSYLQYFSQDQCLLLLGVMRKP